jgi:Protein of unknown function (DUF2742)
MALNANGPPGPRQREGRVHTDPANAKQPASSIQHDYHDDSAWHLTSQQVDWRSVYEYVQRILEGLGIQCFPLAGTPAWASLDDNDPVKLVAALNYAPHWALRIDAAQEAKRRASQAIAAAADWGRVGKYLRDEREFYTANPWLKRRVTQ